jgi:hypothetical protein
VPHSSLTGIRHHVIPLVPSLLADPDTEVITEATQTVARRATTAAAEV